MDRLNKNQICGWGNRGDSEGRQCILITGIEVALHKICSYRCAGRGNEQPLTTRVVTRQKAPLWEARQNQLRFEEDLGWITAFQSVMAVKQARQGRVSGTIGRRKYMGPGLEASLLCGGG